MKFKNIIGNSEFIQLYKTAFLCSRKIPATIILKCYDWAISQRDSCKCVISGFHSTIEKDVFHFLLKGNQPLIMVLARGMKKRFEPEIIKAVDENRLLIISPFENSIKRVTEETSRIRNEFMIELADEVIIGYADPNGLLKNSIKNLSTNNFHFIE